MRTIQKPVVFGQAGFQSPSPHSSRGFAARLIVGSAAKTLFRVRLQSRQLRRLRFALRLSVLQVCASLSSLTFSSRLVCFLWTVLPCLFMFTNTIAYAFRCQPRKQLYLIAFVDLVPVAKEKVSLIRWNTVWNRWKSTLSARSVRVNLNHGKEM